MMATIIDIGNGVFVDSEPIDGPEGAHAPNIYAYASFRSLEHVAFGLMRTTGGPDGEEIDSVEVGGYGMEPIAPYWDVRDAIKDGDSKYAFEEVPLVEVTSKEDYDDALDAVFDVDPMDVDTAWEKPGLYDFRDDPPTYQGSVEDYELESLKDAADQAFEFMFQGDEWEEAYRKLASEED